MKALHVIMGKAREEILQTAIAVFSGNLDLEEGIEFFMPIRLTPNQTRS